MRRRAEVVVRVERALCALMVIGLVSGCTSSGDDKPVIKDPSPAVAASAPPWTEPAAYSFTLTRGCGPAPIGEYRATVKDGVLSAAERVGAVPVVPSSSAEVDLGPVTEGQQGEEIDVPTLGELLGMAETAGADGATVATRFDTTDGHPVQVKINVEDDPAAAECWNVTEYKPAS
ncbi:hypothetical protein [Actinoplanes xinjiangensis]|uniref:hypothetical protein n=1 Tax=Actinoplanes xinjiangensis TaxID=512350 RepID=UPI001EF2AF88|nr:hypothetical protein [Actinoplanes xinjiangensis]